MKVKINQTKLLQPPKVYGGEFQGLPEKVKAMILTGRVVAGIFKAQKETKDNE